MSRGTTALWGIDAGAYLPAWFAWAGALLLGAPLVPPIGAALARGIEALGRGWETPSRSTLLGVFGAVGLLVLALPDRVGFTGDFLLRLSSARASGSPVVIFPQALPLDLWLHYTVPHEIASERIAPVEITSRVLDAIEAGALAVLVLWLARRMGLGGRALGTAVLVMLAGVPLALFTGMNKALTEVLVLAAAVAACTFPRTAPFAPTAATLALLAVALALHRAAFVLAPVAAFGWIEWLRVSAGRARPWQRWSVAILTLVVAALALCAVAPVARVDVPHGLFWPLRRGVPEPIGLRLLDLANLLALLAPAIVLVPAVLLEPSVRIRATKGPAGRWAACLLFPAALLIALIGAPQGYYRDWDMFAIAGLMLSIVSALAIGVFFQHDHQAAWLAPAVVLATLVPCMQVLALQGDPKAGLARAAAFAEAPPWRSTELRASVLAFLGKRAWDRGDLAGAAHHGRRAAELVPTRSMLTLWADSERLLGHDAAAETVYVRLTTNWPDYPRGWLGLARTRLAMGRPAEAAAAAESALGVDPRSIDGAALLRAARTYRVPVARTQDTITPLSGSNRAR